MSVTQDATSLRYIPQSAAEWTTLLAGTGIPNPTVLHLCQEAAGDLADTMGTGQVLAVSGAPSYQQAVAGWSKKAVLCTDGSTSIFQNGSWPNASSLVFMYGSFPASTGAAQRSALTLGASFSSQVALDLKISSNPTIPALITHGDTLTNGASSVASAVHPVLLQANKTSGQGTIQTDLETITHATTAGDNLGTMTLGGNNINFWLSAGVGCIYLAAWTAYEPDATARATLLDRLQNGPSGGVTLSSIAVTPATNAIAVAGTVQLTATGTYSDSSHADLTSSAAWTTSAGAVALVSGAGAAIGTGVGSATITATSGAISGTATVTVSAATLTPTHSVIAYSAPSSGSAHMVAGVSVGAPTATTTTTSPPSGSGNRYGLGTSLPPAPTDSTTWITTDVTSHAGSTLTALQAGSLAYIYVLAIEGYPYLLTNGDPNKAVLAWSGTDYTKALPGLFVNLDSQQSIDPNDAFANEGGTLTFSVHPDPTDQFGIDAHRMNDGAEALLMMQANRYGTIYAAPTQSQLDLSTIVQNLAVDNGTTFSTGDAYIGTECISIQSADHDALWTNVRGKYSPFGTLGGGGSRFAQHHRVVSDTNGVMLNPVVSQQPRTWAGRMVSLHMHKVDGTGLLNSKADSLRVFVGRVATISDDPETGHTVVECDHLLRSIKSTLLGRDMYSATIPEGMQLRAGWVFSIADTVIHLASTLEKSGNDLVVVASGASGSNQVNAGRYSLEEICSILNAWLAGELAAARIQGSYSWASPVTTESGPRTQIQWSMGSSGGDQCEWRLSMPRQVGVFLAVDGSDANPSGVTSGTTQISIPGLGARVNITSGWYVPWRIVLFQQGGSAADDANAQINWTFDIDGDRGVVIDQYDRLPATMKPASSSGLAWGIFLVDEKYLILGSFDPQTSSITNCIPAPYALPGTQVSPSLETFGRRSSDTTSGPLPLRQILILETKLSDFLKAVFYGTGTPGYNHPAWDLLGHGLGLGIPGQLLGDLFDRSVDALPNVDAPIAIVISEPTTISDVLGADLLLRRAFPVWRANFGADGCGGFAFNHWQTPNTDDAVLALAEANKAEPSGNVSNHRSATILTDKWVKNVVKIDYDRDITVNKDGTYQATLTLEDRASVDDTGGDARVMTIEARNTFRQFAGTGAGVEAIAPGYLALMPLFSRPIRISTRSIDQRAFEGYAPGDGVIVTDAFMRDPATGQRGVTQRGAVLTRIRYNPGGLQPGDLSTQGMVGEVDLMFLDLHRYGAYVPSAAVDSSVNVYGFTSGYSATTRELVVKAHEFSETTELADADRFNAGDRIVIHEADPSTPESAFVFPCGIFSKSGNTFTLDRAIAGFDSAKSYRVTYDAYGQCGPTSLQLAKVFQASVATGKIQNVGLPFQWASSGEPNTYAGNGADPAEFLPACAYGDGRPWDVGNERALLRTLNALLDYKTGHNTPFLVQGLAPATGLAAYTVVTTAPIFLGMETCATNITRLLNVAPFLRSSTGATGVVRVTLSRQPPVVTPGLDQTLLVGLLTISFVDLFSQTSWNVGAIGGSDTTWSTGTPQTLQINVKDPNTGVAWLTIETQGRAETKGLAICQESARQVLNFNSDTFTRGR